MMEMPHRTIVDESSSLTPFCGEHSNTTSEPFDCGLGACRCPCGTAHWNAPEICISLTSIEQATID